MEANFLGGNQQLDVLDFVSNVNPLGCPKSVKNQKGKMEKWNTIQTSIHLVYYQASKNTLDY